MSVNGPSKDKGKGKRQWHMPNIWAQHRLLAGGDWRGASLLYRIKQVWDASGKAKKGRLQRCGAEWVAMPREHWAQSAGLSDSEIKNFALPALKTNCGAFLRFEAWKLRHDGKKMLWISVNELAMNDELEHADSHALACISDGLKVDYHAPPVGIGYEPEIDEDGNVVKFPKKAKVPKKASAKKQTL